MKKDKLILTAVIAGLCIVLGFVLLLKFGTAKARPEVCIQKAKNGDFQLLVRGKPYVVKGVVYHPIPIGQNHQYNFWADSNRPWIADGRLMRGIGVNTVRFFTAGEDAVQTRGVIQGFYQRYGIRTILGHWMDYWEPKDYADPQYRQDLTRRILEMVDTYKDEEGILMWVLGNENNLSWHSRANVSWVSPQTEKISDPREKELAKAGIYYSLVNQIAREIKKLDPSRPVALGSADTYSLEVAGKVCPDVDIVAITAYRGKSFGNLWRELKRKVDKPVLILEFGCDRFNAQTGQEDEESQSAFLKSQWQEIRANQAGANGEGNCIGGCVFEWNDEWWKYDENLVSSWYVHNVEANWSSGAYYFDIGAPGNMNMNEEWWGIVGLSPEIENGINKRIPRKAYHELGKMWRGE